MAKEKDILKEKTAETEVSDFSDAENLNSEKQVDEISEDEQNNSLVKTSIKTSDKSLLGENHKYEEEKSSADKVDIEISPEIAEEKLSEIISSQKPQKRKKSTIINLILLLVNIVFMVFIIRGLINNIGEQDFGEYIKKQGSRLWWLAGGIGCYILYMFAQVIMFHALIKSLTAKSKWGLSYDVGITGKYYDNVTPFAVGGQPMQIVKLAGSRLSLGSST